VPDAAAQPICVELRVMPEILAFPHVLPSGFIVVEGALVSILSVVQLLQLPQLLSASFAFTLQEYAPVERVVGVQLAEEGVPVCIAVPLQSVLEYNSTWYPATDEHPFSEGAVHESVGAAVAVHVPPEGESPVGASGAARSI